MDQFVIYGLTVSNQVPLSHLICSGPTLEDAIAKMDTFNGGRLTDYICVFAVEPNDAVTVLEWIPFEGWIEKAC